jgi:translation initiation factor IF-1
MNRWLLLSGGFVSALLLSAGLAVGQTQPKASADCVHKDAPQKVEGQVVAVAPDGKMTVKDNTGKTHSFQVSPEMAKEYKPGDQIEAKLSEGQKKC